MESVGAEKAACHYITYLISAKVNWAIKLIQLSRMIKRRVLLMARSVISSLSKVYWRRLSTVHRSRKLLKHFLSNIVWRRKYVNLLATWHID